MIGTWQLRPIYRFSWITFNEIRCLSLYLVNCTKTTYYNTLRKPFHTSLFDYFIHFYEHECFVSLASNLKIRFFWLFEKKNLFTFYLHMHFIACEKRFAMCIVYESSVKNWKNISQSAVPIPFRILRYDRSRHAQPVEVFQLVRENFMKLEICTGGINKNRNFNLKKRKYYFYELAIPCSVVLRVHRLVNSFPLRFRNTIFDSKERKLHRRTNKNVRSQRIRLKL